MSLIVDAPLIDQLLHLPEELERLTRGSRGQGDGTRHQVQEGRNGWGSVPVDIMETQKSYSFFLDVPGLSKTDIQVTLEEDNTLVVKSENGKRKRDEGEEEGCKYLRLERKASPKFVKKFRLPQDANPFAISAKCENGVLTVVVEKLPPPPEAKPKTVQVKVG